jgi:hypothetical protein
MVDRKTILHELAVRRRIISDGLEVVPHFIIFAPDGPYVVMVEFPDDERGVSKLRLARVPSRATVGHPAYVFR